MELHDTSNLVAHYTSLSTAIEHILSRNQIRFGPLRGMNDPRENKQRAIDLVWNEERPDGQLDRDVRDKLTSSVLDYSKVFCGTSDAMESPHLNTRKCFGRPRMWAQYGDNHRGVCLLFDRAELSKSIQGYISEDAMLFHKNVEYDDRFKKIGLSANILDFDQIFSRGIEVAVANHIDQYHRSFFFRKDLDWASESEYRWVIYRPNLQFEFVPFGSSLKAVVMGCDCSHHYETTIKAVSNNTPVYVLEWNHANEDFTWGWAWQ